MLAGKSVGKSKMCATKNEAKEWLRNNEADMVLIASASGRGKTFAQVAELFTLTPSRAGTKYWAPSHLDYWLAELGGMRIADISRGDINAAVAKLQGTKARHRVVTGEISATVRALSPGTINRYLASLSSVFNFALDMEVVYVHPMKSGGVRKLKEGNGRKRVLTDDEVARLLEAAQASTWRMMPLYLRMLLTTAARKSEVLKLQWQHVNLAESVAILHETKNGRPRAMPLVADVKDALAEAKKVRPLHSDYVFFDPKHPTKPKNIDTIWRFVRQRAGLLNDRDDPLDRVVLHTTRHSAITKMLKGGANLTQAAVVSGHQTLAMLKRYEHLAAQDAVDLAERLLSGTKSKNAA
jgi:integrase